MKKKILKNKIKFEIEYKYKNQLFLLNQVNQCNI